MYSVIENLGSISRRWKRHFDIQGNINRSFLQRCFLTAIIEIIKRCSRHIPANINRGKFNLPKGIKQARQAVAWNCAFPFCAFHVFVFSLFYM